MTVITNFRADLRDPNTHPAPIGDKTGPGAPRSVLIYALGGGRGHAMRGTSLARAFCALGSSSVVLLPDWNDCVAKWVGVNAICLERPASRIELVRRLQAVIEDLQPDLFIVDSFPEGILDEMRDLHATMPSVALLRYRKDASDVRFMRGLSLHDVAIDLEPRLEWLVECHGISRGAPMSRAGPAPERKRRSVDLLTLPSVARWEDVCLRLRRSVEHQGFRVQHIESILPENGSFLNADALRARVVVGPAGFNLSYELAALGSWHVALPIETRYDDQHRRAKSVALLPRCPNSLLGIVMQILRKAAERPYQETWSPDRLAREILSLLRKHR